MKRSSLYKGVLAIISIFALSVSFSGCSTTVRSLSVEEYNEYDVKMTPIVDLMCSNIYVDKGTVLGVSDMTGQTCVIYGKEDVCPKDSLILLDPDTKDRGFLVYPDGKFVYANYPYALFLINKWLIVSAPCNSDQAFKVMEK